MDIDMVYCWCDGNDPEFIKRKNYYLKAETTKHDKDSVGGHRFEDNEELRYSLRSLEMYAPWVRHVYIVTDRQTPKWLNTQYDKVDVIDHSEIMPASLIPCFTASIIERYLANIPGLAEHFLYGNDDMFFGRALTPRFFFHEDGSPIVYVKPYEKFSKITDEEDFNRKYEIVAPWMQSNMNAWKLLFTQYQHPEFYVLAHTIDGYTKSSFNTVLKRYATSFEETEHDRFRTGHVIARNIFGLDMAYSGKASMKVIEKPSFWQKHIHKSKHCTWECYCGSENEKSRKQILRFNPASFCINADSNGTAQSKKEMRDFYEMLFPRPSKFELV